MAEGFGGASRSPHFRLSSARDDFFPAVVFFLPKRGGLATRFAFFCVEVWRIAKERRWIFKGRY